MQPTRSPLLNAQPDENDELRSPDEPHMQARGL